MVQPFQLTSKMMPFGSLNLRVAHAFDDEDPTAVQEAMRAGLDSLLLTSVPVESLEDCAIADSRSAPAAVKFRPWSH